MIRRPPRSTRVRSSAASDVYKRQGLLRQGVYLRHQGHQRRGDIGPDVLLSRYGEKLDPPQWRADHRNEEDQERRRSLEHRRPLSLSLIHISEPTRPY